MNGFKRAQGGLLIRRTWSSAEILKRFLEVFREDGLKALWYKALGETFYRRMLMLECLLTEPPARVASAVPVSFHRLTSSELDAYGKFRAHPGARELQRRLDAGEQAFFARRRGRMVSAVWISHRTARIDYLERRISLKAGEGYLYEAYTHPGFRGNGIGPALFNFAYRTLRDEGFRRILLAVNLENRSARQAFGRSGERVFAKWGYLKIGSRRLDLQSTHFSLPSKG